MPGHSPVKKSRYLFKALVSFFFGDLKDVRISPKYLLFEVWWVFPLFPWVFSVHRAHGEAFACLVSANEMLSDKINPCL